MIRAAKRRPRPEPYRWLFNGSGVVEFYDFQFWKISDPPGLDDDCIVINYWSWLKKERPDISAALFSTSLNV